MPPKKGGKAPAKKAAAGKGKGKSATPKAKDRVNRMRLGVTPEEGEAMPKGALNRQMLMDQLSKFIAHEKGGVEAYEKAKKVITDAERRAVLDKFQAAEARHLEILQAIVTKLGGDPEYESEAAKVNHKKGMGLMSVHSKDATVEEASTIETLSVLEYIDHMHWEFLIKAIDMIDDEEVKAVLEEHVGEIKDAEDEHFDWMTDEMDKVCVKALFSA